VMSGCKMANELVLVVDDDPDILEFVRMALEEEGYSVITAVGGGAIALALERQPAVVLLDIMMPGMDGIEVSRRLRADPHTAAMPIIAMSASDRLRKAETLMSANDTLPKPFSLARLCEKVAHWAQAT
jgi:CheY-like chemotaxis protein